MNQLPRLTLVRLFDRRIKYFQHERDTQYVHQQFPVHTCRQRDIGQTYTNEDINVANDVKTSCAQNRATPEPLNHRRHTRGVPETSGFIFHLSVESDLTSGVRSRKFKCLTSKISIEQMTYIRMSNKYFLCFFSGAYTQGFIAAGTRSCFKFCTYHDRQNGIVYFARNDATLAGAKSIPDAMPLDHLVCAKTYENETFARSQVIFFFPTDGVSSLRCAFNKSVRIQHGASGTFPNGLTSDSRLANCDRFTLQ